MVSSVQWHKQCCCRHSVNCSLCSLYKYSIIQLQSRGCWRNLIEYVYSWCCSPLFLGNLWADGRIVGWGGGTMLWDLLRVVTCKQRAAPAAPSSLNFYFQRLPWKLGHCLGWGQRRFWREQLRCPCNVEPVNSQWTDFWGRDGGDLAALAREQESCCCRNFFRFLFDFRDLNCAPAILT